MLTPQSLFKRRTASVNRRSRKLLPARMNLEALEERRVPAAALPGALASTVAPAGGIDPGRLPVLPIPPATPVITSIVASSANEIDLTWSSERNALSYRLEESSNGGAWTLLGSGGAQSATRSPISAPEPPTRSR
jgi:hypothetical protein